MGGMTHHTSTGEIFHALMLARVLIEMWTREYNDFRPHSALCHRPPVPESIPAPRGPAAA